MTWNEFIHYCGEEIGRVEYWPVTGSAEQAHVDRAYSALVSLLNGIPLTRLNAAYRPATVSLALSGDPKMATLPADIMDGRDDLGLSYVQVGSKVVFPQSFVPPVNFFATYDNPFQEGNLMVSLAVDITLLVSGTTETSASVTHFQKPSKPSLVSVNDGSADWPLNDYDSEVARQIVAAHATAVDAADSASLQIHQILANYYEGGN